MCYPYFSKRRIKRCKTPPLFKVNFGHAFRAKLSIELLKVGLSDASYFDIDLAWGKSWLRKFDETKSCRVSQLRKQWQNVDHYTKQYVYLAH